MAVNTARRIVLCGLGLHRHQDGALAGAWPIGIAIGIAIGICQIAIH